MEIVLKSFGRKRIRLAAVLLGVLVVLAGSLFVAARSTAATGNPPTQLFPGAGATYPRLIRLAHSGDANGRVIASVNSWDQNGGVGAFLESTDDGHTFHPISFIRDPLAAGGAASGQGLCCSSIFELPRPVGALPAGTLLWADSTGINAQLNARQPRQRLWRSLDHGHTWDFLSDIAISPNHNRNWESELSVSADGHLVDFYSDESDFVHHSQKLVQVRSTDGIHWTDGRDTVVDDDWQVRPGMANVRVLPNGTYFMSYEVCNNDKVHLCAAYERTSIDGWDYGDPRNLGAVIRTPDGKYARHTPTIAWAPGPGPNGRILLTSEMLVNDDGSMAQNNGGAILVNDRNGAGPWVEEPAPIPLHDAHNAGCMNFSPTLLPSVDGTSVTEVTITQDPGGPCYALLDAAPLNP